MTNLQAIDTVFDGYRFRSRLEARTALMLKAMGVRYVYEEEGFVFPDGTKYLPDFYLPDQDAFLEVKGVMRQKDMHKIKMLWWESGKAVIIVDSNLNLRIFDSEDRLFNSPDPTGDDCQVYRCAVCRKINFISTQNSYKCMCCGAYDGDYYLMGAKYEEARALAKQARFETNNR